MRRTTTTLLVVTLLLSGCGSVRDSRLNPFNWFGRSKDVPVEQTQVGEVNPLIPQARQGLFARRKAYLELLQITDPIDQVTDLRAERVPGGAIIRVTGLDRTQGAFNVQLVPQNEDEKPVDGILTYSMERQLPPTPQAVGPVQTREVVAAVSLTNQQLRGVRRIRVVAARNTREIRR